MATVLVVGAGGREHALAWKLAESTGVDRIIVAPGNEGFPSNWERWPLSLNGNRSDFQALADRAVDEDVDLVVVGPDNPLAEGIVDVLTELDLKVFGPTSGAAKIESSKAFAKEVMTAAGVPTAKFFVATSMSEAKKFLIQAPWPPQKGIGWVIKADGLAYGKGVRVCSKLNDAIQAVEELFPISQKLVIEERLEGQEISWMAFCDGERCSLLEPARDYKRLLDGDQGPNTGGMGAFSPVPGIPSGYHDRVRKEIFLPTLAEMKKRGTPFRGLLFAGLMVNPGTDQIWVIEFNSRFGDPETQALMLRLDDDLYEWCMAVAKGDLSGWPERVPFSEMAAVVVVGAAEGYPQNPKKGTPIQGLFSGEGNEIPPFFLAGVAKSGDQWITAGGRVLGALGLGGDLEQARASAYRNLETVKFEGMQFRKDIAKAP